MHLISCCIDTNQRLELIDSIIINYKGIIFKLTKGDSKWTDHIELHIKKEENKYPDLKILYEYFSALSYENEAIIISKVRGGFTFKEEKRLEEIEKCIQSQRTILPNAGPLKLSCIPKIENENQATAISLYRESISARSPFYKFLCYWKIIELATGNKWDAEKTRNKILLNYRNIYFPDKKLQIDLGIDKGNLAKMLYHDYRNTLEHITNPNSRTADNPRDIEEVTYKNDFMERMIKTFIKDEFKMHEKLYLVKMPKEQYPMYVPKTERDEDKLNKS